MNQVFQEGRLQFRFSRQWLVRKYDDHTFYRGLSGLGLKGVDFIALPPEGPLLLLEVKHYFNEHPQFRGPLDPTALPPVEELAAKLLQKGRDTHKAIVQIEAYLQRKFLFRWLYPWLLRCRWSAGSWCFWAQVGHWNRVQEPPCELVIWLQAAPSQQSWAQALAQALQEQAGQFPFTCRLVQGTDQPFFPAVEVQELPLNEE